jgi:hypothetical protein
MKYLYLSDNEFTGSMPAEPDRSGHEQPQGRPSTPLDQVGQRHEWQAASANLVTMYPTVKNSAFVARPESQSQRGLPVYSGFNPSN